jgi:hypothetical protein
MVPYSQPGQNDKGSAADRELIQEITDELVNLEDTRDGIPHELFPLGSEELQYYKFALKGETDVRGRRSFDIVFEPVDKELCIHLGEAIGEDIGDDTCHQWKGEAWIDAEDYQPSRIDTQMARCAMGRASVPWHQRSPTGVLNQLPAHRRKCLVPKHSGPSPTFAFLNDERASSVARLP